MALIPFLFIDASNAAKYLERWKPQMIAGQLVSGSGVNAYARAHIDLRNPNCVGMLVDLRNTGYVIYKGEDETYGVASCLWVNGEPSLQGFRDLREWCHCMLDVKVKGIHLKDELEKELWNLSIFDA